MANRQKHLSILIRVEEYIYHEKWWWLRLLVTIFIFLGIVFSQTKNSIVATCTSFSSSQRNSSYIAFPEGVLFSRPNLSIIKNNKDTGVCGSFGMFTYPLTVKNIGHTDAVNETIIYNFPSDLISYTWSCSNSSPTTACAQGTFSTNINDTITIPVGESITYTVEVFTMSMSGILLQVFRYSLAPFAALLGAFMLGAHYIDDIYNLKNYRSALFYLWATIFNGKSTRFFSGIIAFAPSMLIILFTLSYLDLPIELSPINVLFFLIFSIMGGLVIGFLFGKSFLPEMTISEGKKDFDTGSKAIDVIGGSGWVYVEPSNAILLERIDSPSDIFGAGRYFLPRSQRVKDIFSLKDQHAPPRDLVAHSLDGIKVTVKNFQFRYRLHTGKDKVTKRTQSSPYPFSVEAVRKVAYERNVTVSGELASLENVIQFGFDGVVLSYIRENKLGDILAPKQEPHKKFDEEINSAKTRDTIKNKGAELLWHDTGYFEVEDSIDEEKIITWLAKITGRADIIRAQGRAEVIAHKERAHAEGQVAILHGITQALESAGLPDNLDENLWNIVISQSSQILETMNKASQNNPVDRPENKNEPEG